MKTFDDWMIAVDRELKRICGVNSADLPDQEYAGWYENGVEPEDAALEVLELGVLKSDELRWRMRKSGVVIGILLTKPER